VLSWQLQLTAVCYNKSKKYNNLRSLYIVAFALLTTLGLQILSNFANDYGDGVKGTDNADRVGPKRAIQKGVITPFEMKNAMILTSFITLCFAILLIYFAFKESYLLYSFVFFLL
jgi:1,4-dihydroxy-2-naphthoate octaprenyltransferase